MPCAPPNRRKQTARKSTGTSVPRQQQSQSAQGASSGRPTNFSGPSHISQGERGTQSTRGGSTHTLSSHRTTSSTASGSSSQHRQTHSYRNYSAGGGSRQRNVSGPSRGSASHTSRSNQRSSGSSYGSGSRARSSHAPGGTSGRGGGRTNRRGREEYLDSHDGYDNFMVSFGLKPWELDDLDMGERIIEECTSYRG